MKKRPLLVIRADADLRIGTGHVMRSLALAQAWQRSGGRVILAASSISPQLKLRLKTEKVPCFLLRARIGSSADALKLVALAKTSGACWIALDGYAFTAAYQKAIRRAGIPFLFVDDYSHLSAYDADIVLNQNVYASSKLYRRKAVRSRLLLGLQYCLLRDEFLSVRQRSGGRRDGVKRILVTLGGSDPANVTLKVVKALCRLDRGSIRKDVIVGMCNPHLAEIQRVLRGRSDFAVIVNTTKMPEYMAAADIAVFAAGTTTWELAYMGLPGLTMILSANQRMIARHVERIGFAVNLGEVRQLTISTITAKLRWIVDQPDRSRYEMSMTGRRLIDGCGADRVVDVMFQRIGRDRRPNRAEKSA
jgi:UDP-2,4-diacetamido-2,4,6-trideoxy-beta-L-altropyranose hydrolase